MQTRVEIVGSSIAMHESGFSILIDANSGLQDLQLYDTDCADEAYEMLSELAELNSLPHIPKHIVYALDPVYVRNWLKAQDVASIPVCKTLERWLQDDTHIAQISVRL